MRVNGRVNISFSESLSVAGVGSMDKKSVFIFKMKATRAWLYADGDYSQRQGNIDEEEGEHEETES